MIEIKKCTKRTYKTEKEAKAEIKKIKKSIRLNAKTRKITGLKQERMRKMAVYPCRWCGLFHLTSQPQRK